MDITHPDFDKKKKKKKKKKNGIGIENMRRRAAFIGGDVTFTSGTGKNGLQIMVSIPLEITSHNHTKLPKHT